MSSREAPVEFPCDGHRLHGILHVPAGEYRCGVLMVHGRPEYRIGVHRRLLELARIWADAGFGVMRFDYRGSGDSEGEMSTLEESSADIAAAVDAFKANLPGLDEVVLWGSCAGATDALLYAPKDRRLTGIVLVNPWAYDAPGRVRAKLRHYSSHYLRLLLSPSGWARTLADLKQKERVRSFLALHTEKRITPDSSTAEGDCMPGLTARAARVLRTYRTPGVAQRLAKSLSRFRGRVLLILSGGDPIARSFQKLAEDSPEWRRLLGAEQVRRYDIPEAYHWRREWIDLAARRTLDWLRDDSRAKPLAGQASDLGAVTFPVGRQP
jgi:exosortase A-associated hydrolase 1